MKYIFLLISVGFYGFCVCQRSLVSTNDSHSIENKVTTTPQSRVVSLTTQGTGNTIEDAKNNALRSAIEQAFGVYISSNLVILNDSIIKDEIVSITSGNVQEFEILSQLKISDNEYLVSIKSTLSIYNLTKYFESKGVEIEFKGNSFVENIKLQKYINQDTICNQIIDTILTDKFMAWDPLPLPSESYVQWKLRELGYEIRCHGLDIFPTTSVQLKELLYNP